MNLTAEQQSVVDSTSPVVLVLGGAGTGKTTTAAFLARRALLEKAMNGIHGRALFLSFSRSSVAQVMSRTEQLLGRFALDVQVTTFHAFAWALIERWGNAIGLADPVLFSPAEKKLFGTASGLSYDDLIPAALRICELSPVSEYLRRRWSLLVVDEFQDTNDVQWQFIHALRGRARLVLLGDMDQCIYGTLPNASGVGPERLRAALALPNVERIDLPDVSHRDPTQVIPAAAQAVRRRDFSHPAIRAALDAGALEIISENDPKQEVAGVIDQIERLRQDGMGVGVFSHHIDLTATLSDGLSGAGMAHEIVGIPDAVDTALAAQFAMLRFACEEVEFTEVLKSLAIFIAACERGNAAPPLALAVAGLRRRPDSLEARLQSLSASLTAAESLGEAVDIAANTHDGIGLTRGASPWHSAGRLLQGMLGPRALLAAGFPPQGVNHLEGKLIAEHLSLLTYNHEAEATPVQLMGLYQTKGREVDTSIIVLRASDFFGKEAEPMPHGSKLLYVLLTRARKRTVVLAIGSPMPPLVLPLVQLG